MARTSKTVKTIPRHSGKAPPRVDAGPFEAGIAHAWLDAPMQASMSLLRVFEQLQQAQAQALHGTDSPLGPVVAEADGSRGLEDLFGLPITLAAEQFSIMARLSSECFGDVLDVERQWLEQVEAATGEMARDWLSSHGWLTAPSTRAALELPLGASPLGLFNNTQAALAEMAKIWVDAVEHDVQQHA